MESNVKEYLTESRDGSYVLVNHKFTERDIEVPEGAEMLTEDDSNTLTFWKEKDVSMNVGENVGWLNPKDDGTLTFYEYLLYGCTVLWKREETMTSENQIPVDHSELFKKIKSGEVKLDFSKSKGVEKQDYDIVNKPKHYNSDPSGVIKNKFNPLASQSGGNHYKIHGVQPVEYTMGNNLSFCQGNIIKYITRYADKNGLEDLEKVIHYTLLEAYFKYGEDGSEELKQRVLKLFNK